MDALPSRRIATIDFIVVIAVFLACSAAEPALDPVLRQGRGLAGVLALAGYQFACEGLAPVLMMIVRREALSDFGFVRRNAAKSVALGLLLAGIHDLAMSWRAGALLWIPLGRHTATRMSLEAGFPANILGLAITAAVWGFVESFFGVYFARKLNGALGVGPAEATPGAMQVPEPLANAGARGARGARGGRGWLSAGALGFALFNGLIHFAIGQGFEGFITSFATGYAIAVIPAVTENAWGSAVVQVLTNALGRR